MRIINHVWYLIAMDRKRITMYLGKLKKPIIIFTFLLLASSCNLPEKTLSSTATLQVLAPTTASPGINSESQTPQTQLPTQTITNTEAPSSNGQLVLDKDNAGRLKILATLKTEEPVRMKWSLDQKTFAVIAYQSFKIYSYPELKLMNTIVIQPEEMLIDISPSSNEYILSKDQESLIVINWKDASTRTIPIEAPFMYGELSPNGSLILLDQQDHWAGMVYDIQSGQKITTLSGFETAAPVYSVSFGADGKHALWHARATIQVADIATNTLGTAIYHEDFLSGFALSPNGEILATSTSQMKNDVPVPQIFFYEPMSGTLLGMTELGIPAYSLDFSPDSQLLAASDSKDLVIVDTITMSFLARYPADAENVNQVLFSPDGSIITTTGSDQTVNFWGYSK